MIRSFFTALETAAYLASEFIYCPLVDRLFGRGNAYERAVAEQAAELQRLADNDL